METKVLVNYLESHGIDSVYSHEMAQKIEKANKNIYNAVVDYIEKGIEPTISVEGYSCKQLMQQFNMSVIAALLTLDWLLREPELAKQAILDGIK